ncbi:MAG: type VI secretion system tip protein VgrG [Geobacteraceae bacterium]|nr:type VI secretion system tip protein VgrG [Geobacteraceae bacterium]
MFNSAASKAHFTFKLLGNSLETRVLHFGASEQISGIFVSQLSLATVEEIKSFDNIIGKEALLTIVNSDPLSGGGDRYLHGVVRSFRYTGRNGRFYLYAAEVAPTFWQFSLRKNSRIFQKKQAQEIVQQVLEDGGITSDRFRFALENTTRLRKFCVQYRETDFDFISRILEEEGIFYFFEHYQDKHIMVMSDTPAVHLPIQGIKAITCNSHGGLVAEKESISTFTYSQHQTPDAYTHRNFNFKNPPLDLTAKGIGQQQGKFEIYDYPALHVDQDRGNTLASVRIEQLTSLQKLGNGKSSSCRLIPGCTFTLAGHDSISLNGNYLLIRVAHSGSQPQSLEEKAGGGASYGNSFTVIPATTTFRPPITMHKPVVKGIQTATVVGPKGAEIHTDEYGRVRVQFHWDREGKRDENSSCWIRCGQAWGGLSRGGQFIPRIGDEVLVDFVDGDPDRPNITGSVYNSDNMPINNLKKSITQSGFKTKTHKGNGFHELRFDDAKGKEEIYLQSEKDWNVLVKNRKGETVGGDSGTIIGRNRDTSVGGNSYTIVKGKSTEKAKEIIIGASEKITIVSGASSIVITPAGIKINNPSRVDINDGSSAPMPQEQPVSGCAGKGGSSGGGGGKKVGGSSSKNAAKPGAALNQAAKGDVAPVAPSAADTQLEKFKDTVPSGGWAELDSAGSVPEYDGWTLGPVSQGASGLGDFVSSGSSSPLLKGAGLPGAGDLVSSATSSLPGDLKNRVSQVASVVQNPASLKDTAVNEGKNRLNRELNNAKGNLLEKTGIGEAQNEANQELNKLMDLLKSPRIKQEDLLKKF